jgi:hypothetical protein
MNFDAGRVKRSKNTSLRRLSSGEEAIAKAARSERSFASSSPPLLTNYGIDEA